MKAMISQPMHGRSDDQIITTRERAVSFLQEKGYEIVNTLFTDEWYSDQSMLERGIVQIPLCFLAKSLENMSLCHAAYFCKGWENARGCRIEHEAAKAYGLEILYEQQETCTDIWSKTKGHHHAFGVDDRHRHACKADFSKHSIDRFLSQCSHADSIEELGREAPAKAPTPE